MFHGVGVSGLDKVLSNPSWMKDAFTARDDRGHLENCWTVSFVRIDKHGDGKASYYHAIIPQGLNPIEMTHYLKFGGLKAFYNEIQQTPNDNFLALDSFTKNSENKKDWFWVSALDPDKDRHLFICSIHQKAIKKGMKEGKSLDKMVSSSIAWVDEQVCKQIGPQGFVRGNELLTESGVTKENPLDLQFDSEGRLVNWDVEKYN